MDEYLSNVYYNIGHPSSFSSKEKLYIQAKKDGKPYTLSEIEHWLEGEPTYTLFKPVVNNIARSVVIVPYTNYEYESDCMYMKRWTSYNSSFSFIMVFIDIFTRFLWCFPMKRLLGSESAEIFSKFLAENHCEVLKTDSGSEYISHKVQKILKEYNIKHIIARNGPKANFAERVIKSLKSKLTKNIYFEESYKWIDNLDPAVYSYNNTYHDSIKMTPAEARVADPSIVWANQYLPVNKSTKEKTMSDSAIAPEIPPEQNNTGEDNSVSPSPENSGVEEESPSPGRSSEKEIPVQNNVPNLPQINNQPGPLYENQDLHNIDRRRTMRANRRMAGGGTATQVTGKSRLKHKSRDKPINFRFNIGDTVRIARLYHKFKRAYDENWTHELFTVVGRSVQQGFPKYTLKSWANELIDGDFYQQEIQKVDVSDDTVYKIDKVIRSQKREGIPGKIVSWLGWGSAYNSWVSNQDFRSIKDRRV